MSYTKPDLLQDLADMGLTGQETILIHSSMKSIGPVDGGADTVLDGALPYYNVCPFRSLMSICVSRCKMILLTMEL